MWFLLSSAAYPTTKAASIEYEGFIPELLVTQGLAKGKKRKSASVRTSFCFAQVVV